MAARKATRVAHVVRAAEGDAAEATDAFSGLKPTKVAEFKSMSNDDLNGGDGLGEEDALRAAHAPVHPQGVQGHHFGILKKKIAQIRTVKREREVSEGVNKRDSRKIKREERAANIYL